MISTTGSLYRQRGALSLLWCVVFFTILTLSAMAALFSIRYETHYFAHAWKKLIKTPVMERMQHVSIKSIEPLKGEQTPKTIKKCMVEGKVMYSNVECKAADATTREVPIQATQAAPPSKKANSSPARNLLDP